MTDPPRINEAKLAGKHICDACSEVITEAYYETQTERGNYAKFCRECLADDQAVNSTLAAVDAKGLDAMQRHRPVQYAKACNEAAEHDYSKGWTHGHRPGIDTIDLPDDFDLQTHLKQWFAEMYAMEDPADWNVDHPLPSVKLARAYCKLEVLKSRGSIVRIPHGVSLEDAI